MKRGRWVPAVLGLAVVAGALAWRSDRLLFDRPERLERRGREGVRAALAASGVVAAWNFDGPEVVETLSGQVARTNGAVLDDARFGAGRRFTGKPGASIVTGVPWGRLGPSWTLSLWVKILRPPEYQGLVNASDATDAGLRIFEGRMSFSVSGVRTQTAAYPFERYGEFVHLAAVVDNAAGRVRLYENGVLRAEAPAGTPPAPGTVVVFGKTLANRASSPLRAVFDEAVWYGRPFGDGDVARLARARFSLDTRAWRLAPGPSLRRLAGVALGEIVAGVCDLADAFNPLLLDRRTPAEHGVPTLNLVLSNKDLRAVDRWFRRARTRGLEGDPEQAQRTIGVSLGDRVAPARLRPYAPAPAFWEHPKRSLVVECDEPLPGLGGRRRVLLVPPETRGLLLPLVQQELARRHRTAPVPGGLVAVRLNGLSKGYYRFEPWAPPGAVERLEAPAPPGLVGALPYPEGEVLAVYDEVRARVEPLLRADRLAGISTRRLSRQLARDRRLLQDAVAAERGRTGAERAAAVAGALREADFLDGNPAREYLLHDLKLTAPALPGVAVRWRSLNPDVLDDAGRVRRPVDGPPVEAAIEARVEAGGAAATRVLRFAVVPLSHRLPVLSLAVAEAINNDARVPVRAEYFDAAGLPVAGELAGGVKFRGNSALKRPKKSFSLHLADRGVFFPGSASPTVYLMSCYTDASYLNDRLSYDLFRAFRAGEAHAASVRISHLVVFVNGEYQGLYQISERIDRHLLGMPAYRAGDAEPGLIFKAQDATANFERPVLGAYRQIQPDPADLDVRAALGELITFIGSSSPAAFAGGIGGRLDVGNFLDYLLLTNLSRNAEGVNYNFTLARDAGRGGQFFFVPWDYDKAYRRATTGWMNNHLSRRLLNDVPGFPERVAARWRELRAGPLAAAALDARLDAYAAEIGPSAEVDRLRWRPAEASPAAGTQALKAWLHTRLAGLDEAMLEIRGLAAERPRARLRGGARR
jgi:hypothetical protein